MMESVASQPGWMPALKRLGTTLLLYCIFLVPRSQSQGTCTILLQSGFENTTELDQFNFQPTTNFAHGSPQWQVWNRSKIFGYTQQEVDTTGSAVVSAGIMDKDATPFPLCSHELQPPTQTSQSMTPVCSVMFSYFLWWHALEQVRQSPSSIFQAEVLQDTASGSAQVWTVVKNCCLQVRVRQWIPVNMSISTSQPLKVQFFHHDTSGKTILLLDNISVCCSQDRLEPTTTISTDTTQFANATHASLPEAGGQNIALIAVVSGLVSCLFVLGSVPFVKWGVNRWRQRIGYQLTPTRDNITNDYRRRLRESHRAQGTEITGDSCCNGGNGDGDTQSALNSGIYDLVGPPSLPKRRMANEPRYASPLVVTSGDTCPMQLSAADESGHQPKCANDYNIDESPPGCNATGESIVLKLTPPGDAATDTKSSQNSLAKSKRLSCRSGASFDSVTPRRSASGTASADSRYIYNNSPLGSSHWQDACPSQGSKTSEGYEKPAVLKVTPTGDSTYLPPADVMPASSDTPSQVRFQVSNVPESFVTVSLSPDPAYCSVAGEKSPSSSTRAVLSTTALPAAKPIPRLGRRAMAVITPMSAQSKHSRQNTEKSAKDLTPKALQTRDAAANQQMPDQENKLPHYEEVKSTARPFAGHSQRLHHDPR